MINTLSRIFGNRKNRPENTNEREVDTSLSFEGLNPLLAKQLSELESQIGQLAQIQFDLSQERKSMRIEMEALKKAVGEPNPLLNPLSPDNETVQ